MTAPEIQAALTKAGDALHVEYLTGDDSRDIAVIAIVAFLQAVPLGWVRDTYGTDEAIYHGLLSAAVELARKEGA